MDFTKIFDLAFFQSQFVGLKLNYKENWKGWLFKLLAVYVLIMLLLQLITTIIYVKIHIKDVLVFTDTAAPTLTGFCLALKLMGYYATLGYLRNVVKTINNYTIPMIDESEKQFINVGLIQCRKIRIAYTISLTLTTTSIILNSLIVNLATSARSFQLNSFNLGFLSILKVSPIFEVTWIVFAILLYQIALGFIGSTSLCCNIGLTLTAHLRILQMRFQKMRFEKQEFLGLIKYQKKIWNCCVEFNRIYDASSFTQMTLSIGLSCLLIFLFMTVRHSLIFI